MTKLSGCAILCVAAWAPASELVVRDLVVGISAPPSGFAYEVTDSTGTRSGQDAFDTVGGLSLGLTWSFAGPGRSTGLVVGGQLVGERGAVAGGGVWQGLGADLSLGYGWAITDRLILVPQLVAGPRKHRLSVDGTAVSGFAVQGLGRQYGARLALTYALADRLVGGLECGWRTGNATLTGDRELVFEQRGVTVGLVFGWHFSATPVGLE